MSDSFLVDSNILVYAYDRSEATKQKKARDVLDWLELRRAGVLSTQILGEFFSVATRKLAKSLASEELYQALEDYLRSWRTLPITRAIVLEAARGAVAYQLPYWDAQVWATAKLNQIPRVLSEDFQHQGRIEGVEFLNPFMAKIPGEV